MSEIFYLDHCGSTPLDPAVAKVLIEGVQKNHFGNPTASHHKAGLLASQEVEASRLAIATELHCAPHQIIFTGGASEANNLVILGFWLRFRDRGCRILYGATEHKSVLEPSKQVADLPNGSGVELPVDSFGVIDLAVLEKLLADNPKKVPTLVALMQTNNEIPARHPVEKIAALCKTYKSYFHCDAVQAFVREPLDLSSGCYGSVVISPHKIYGPKGIGILALADSILKPPVIPPYTGGEQEFSMRPGTSNTLAIGAAAAAIKIHSANREKLLAHMRVCDEAFCETMQKNADGFHLTVPMNTTVPGIINFYLEGHDAPSLLLRLQKTCINRGASCTGSGGEKFSHVPRALGLPIEVEANVLRASFGFGCTVEEVVMAANEICSLLSSK